jgi:hypothetical protein
MIQTQYEKHAELLSTVGKTPDSILCEISHLAREWASEVKKNYEETTTLAPSKAYFGHKRSEGGCFKALKGAQTTSRRRMNHRLEKHSTRVDPPHLYLFGKAGVGKSFLTNRITKKLSERFGFKDSSVYFRNFKQDHWDGYHGQLITQVDDIFQVISSNTNQEELEKDLILLKSNCEMQTPMADLAEKGRKFTSEFLVTSGNKNPLIVVDQTKTVSCKDALFRRFDICVELLDRKPYRARISIRTKNEFVYAMTHLDVERMTGFKTHYIESQTCDSLVNQVVQMMVDLYDQSVKSAFLSKDLPLPGDFGWKQNLTKEELNLPHLAYCFPKVPDCEAIVEAHAIPEPLKVRMITKGQPITWALKPLQKAMWKSLKSFECFKLTGDPDVESAVQILKDQEGFWRSGDYSAATDNLHSDVMQAVLKPLIEEFKDHESLLEYLKWESGVHEVRYPKFTGIEPIYQTRGQLMGSLISFPVLCVANACTLAIVRKQQISELKALINGDDILFRSSDKVYKSWWRVASQMGLIPSVGKNYVFPDFGSINSQIVYQKKKGKVVVLPTGKFKPLAAPSSNAVFSLSEEYGQ